MHFYKETLVLASLLLTACGGYPKDVVRSEADHFLSTLRDGDYEAAHAYLGGNLPKFCRDSAELAEKVQAAGAQPRTWSYDYEKGSSSVAFLEAHALFTGGHRGYISLVLDEASGKWIITAWSANNSELCVLPREDDSSREREETLSPKREAIMEDSGAKTYAESVTIDAAAARGLRPGSATPEAAVTHFYASRVRGDKLWKEVVVRDRSRRLKSSLKKLDKWRFKEFRLVSRTPTSSQGYWVKVWMDFEVGGNHESGTDEVEVRQVDGRWLIFDVPS